MNKINLNHFLVQASGGCTFLSMGIAPDYTNECLGDVETSQPVQKNLQARQQCTRIFEVHNPDDTRCIRTLELNQALRKGAEFPVNVIDDYLEDIRVLSGN